MAKIKCVKCGEVIESKSVHDYVPCKCGAIAIDGGQEYTKITGNYEDIVWADDPSLTGVPFSPLTGQPHTHDLKRHDGFYY